MKNLTLAFMVAMAFVSVGCKKKAGGAGAAMAKMTEFKDEMCKCKDAKCAQDVSDKMTKWTQEQTKGGEPPKMSEGDTKAAAAIGEEMGKCMQTAMGAGMTPPPVEGSAAPVEGSAAGSAPAEGSAAGSAAPAGSAPAEGSAAAPAGSAH